MDAAEKQVINLRSETVYNVLFFTTAAEVCPWSAIRLQTFTWGDTAKAATARHGVACYEGAW